MTAPRFWINPNPIINQNVTFNCANNGEIDALFNSLARKRIQPDKTVTIKLAQAIFGPFKTFHIDSDRIIVAGTMKAARPTVVGLRQDGHRARARARPTAPTTSRCCGRGMAPKFDFKTPISTDVCSTTARAASRSKTS